MTRHLINPNPKTVNQYKFECHKLMEKIWGKDYYGRKKAYRHISKKFGKVIHFADINDIDLLREIQLYLWKLTFKNN